MSLFYNDIGQQMLPCQKPIMLEDAVRFEDVLRNPRGTDNQKISWKNVAELDAYLRSKNNMITKTQAQPNIYYLSKWSLFSGN